MAIGRALLTVAALGAAACAAPARPMRAGCVEIRTATDPESLRSLYAQHRAPLVVLDGAVLLCACGVRSWGGCVERRDLGGAVEALAHGGAVEARAHGGSVEARAHGGAVEDRTHGGAVEDRAHGGAVEARDVGGAAQSFGCEEVDGCAGFRVSGAGPFRVFDGREVVEVRDRCVRD